MVLNDPPRYARTRPAWIHGGTVRAGGGRRGRARTAGLVARSAAFSMVDTTRTLPLAAGESVRMFGALRAGSVIARRYPADLAAARALAQASPPLRTVRPDSRPAAELALQIALINGENTGCGSGGGRVYPGPRPVRWETVVTEVGRFDGTIGGIMFAATYTVASGWLVELNAC